MTPQLNLLLQKKKKKYVKLLVSMRFGQRQNNTAERRLGRNSFRFFPSEEEMTSWPGVGAHPAWSQDLEQGPGAYPDEDENAASGNY